MTRRASTKLIVERLRKRYDFDLLGNFEDPLDELIYITLSARTRGVVFQATFQRLRRCYPTWAKVAAAPLHELADVLRPIGLERKKSRWLLATLQEIRDREGTESLDRLHDLSDADAESYLVSLPGIGRKSARCILLYSLGRQVLPMDTHTRRLMERLKLIDAGIHYSKIHDVGQSRIPAQLRMDFHVFAVIHGRATCTSMRPKCVTCVLQDLCPSAMLTTTRESD